MKRQAAFSASVPTLRSLVCLLLVACPCSSALSQQEARFDADRRYDASSSRSYDAAVAPELYVPAARPRSASYRDAIPQKSTERMSSLEAHPLSDRSRLQHEAEIATASPVRMTEITRFSNLHSSAQTGVYRTLLPQKASPLPTVRPTLSHETHAQHATLSSIAARPSLPQSKIKSTIEPGFSRRHRAPSDPASRVTAAAP